VGDAVKAPGVRTAQFRQAADFHLLSGDLGPSEAGAVDLVGVGEVKSYALSRRRLRRQIRRHLERAAQGLRLPSATIPAGRIRVGRFGGRPPLRIGIVPAGWKLPRTIDLRTVEGHEMLYYAILRARTRREDERAIALYNTYGFGYALGTSFRDAKGRRQMLWPKDLREVLDHGASRQGYRFWS